MVYGITICCLKGKNGCECEFKSAVTRSLEALCSRELKTFCPSAASGPVPMSRGHCSVIMGMEYFHNC